MSALCTSTWGDPAATRRVLLIHGITGSSNSWYRIGQEFASRGYFVTAPDLLGHGNARRGSDYSIAALSEEIRPLFMIPARDDPPFDIVIGYSLGGVVATSLLPLLKSARPVRVVLVDPPLEQTPESVAYYRKLFGDAIRNTKTPEAYREEHPLLTERDVLMFHMTVRLCDVDAVEAILDQNVPWSFAHQLSAAPDNVQVTVLAADPVGPHCVEVEELRLYPHVTARTVWGASHLIPFEKPMVVVGTALEERDN